MNDNDNSHKIFNNVVQAILTLKSEMYLFECEEYLIAPSDVGKTRSLLMDKRTLYNIKDVAQSVLIKGKVRVDKKT